MHAKIWILDRNLVHFAAELRDALTSIAAETMPKGLAKIEGAAMASRRNGRFWVMLQAYDGDVYLPESSGTYDLQDEAELLAWLRKEIELGGKAGRLRNDINLSRDSTVTGSVERMLNDPGNRRKFSAMVRSR